MESNYVDINSRLIDECRNGSSKAQFEIYKLYYKAMYNTCLRFVRDSMEAEDVMQEAFLAAFRNIDSFRGEVSFGAWLKRIVVNRSLDALRRKRLDLDPIEEGRMVIDTDDYTDDETVYKVEQVKKAIASLPDSYRVLLTLHLIEGYDHEEIAQIMEMSNAAVRTAYSRARKKLQEMLETKKNQIWMN
ncbi:MAG: RNA polymerase sigma factor [Salinivirgaceae bacterium]|nr:RNA polymerase sigma factor [Salinivirgaceae bacterium]